jgi:hypothetical protein
MGQLWSFIGQKKCREILAWIGGGLAAAIIGLWTTFVYFFDKFKTSASTPGVQASCGSVATSGMFGNTITTSNTGNCPEQKLGSKP